MLAWETARTWWQEHSTVPFEERLGWHLACGLVYSTQDCFLMASEATWDHGGQEIVEGTKNAWFVELAVLSPSAFSLQPSALSLLLQVAPHPREWILFRRNNGFKIHAWRWDHFARRVGFTR